MIEIVGLSKTYAGTGRPALNDVSLQVPRGAVYGILGRSGAGKSTLIRCLNLLERPTSGRIIVNGNDITRMDKTALREYRLRTGMIFQHFNLLHARSVADNVAVPLEIAKVPKAARQARVTELLELVGLADKAAAFPSQLSGGQKQRVGIARALAARPDVLLCDEATSALDPKTTSSILDLLEDINKRLNLTIIMVTHQMEVVKRLCHSLLMLDGGKTVAMGKTENLFLSPTKEMQAMVEDEYTLIPGGTNIRLMFPREISQQSVITQMARTLGIDFSIVGGKLERYLDDVFGFLIINVQDKDLDAVLHYLKMQNLFWEILAYSENAGEQA